MAGRFDNCDACDAKFTLLPQLRSFNVLPRLRTNENLPSSVDNQLSQLLAAAESEAALYDAEVVRLYSRIIAVENAKREFDKQVLRCKSLRAPIRKLPLELIRTVYKECFREAALGYCPKASDIPALQLARVCTYWRDIALSMGVLWSSISIDVRSWGEKQLAATRALMERAGDSLLDITLFESVDTEYSLQRHPAVDLLMTSSNQWRSLQVDLPFELALVLLAPVRANLANLEVLMVNFPHDCGFHGTDSSVDLFEIAPKLRDLAIESRYPNQILLPYSNIQHYRHEGGKIGHFLDVWSRCSNIRSVDIDGITPDPAGVNLPFVSPLRVLSVNITDEEDAAVINDLLSNITTTHLSSFHLSSVDDVPATKHLIKNLPLFLSRSATTLTCLDLEDVWISPTRLQSILQCTPGLIDLTILEVSKSVSESAMLISRIIHAMNTHTIEVHGSSPRVLVPRLEHLKLQLHGGTGSVSEQSLVDMIRSRWRPGAIAAADPDEAACLRTVSLTTYRPLPRRPLQAVQYLRQAGMAIHFTEVKEVQQTVSKN
ncbi:hypothetical protein C8J56DRAFT_242942 [Mycena floridula]|nr:hypothetical protein C8J56DRAFT_242942 [Mycena floridula]